MSCILFLILFFNHIGWHRIRVRVNKGCWIVPYHIDHTILDNYEKNKKFVLDKGSKRFAYESRKRAFNSFIIRKFRQIGILKHQLEVANEMYKQAEQIYKDTFK